MIKKFSLGIFLLIVSVSNVTAQIQFQVLPSWVAEPVLDASMDTCIKGNELGRFYSTLAHGTWASFRGGVTMSKKELQMLPLGELSKLSYVQTGGQIVNIEGETIEFLDWRGISISRILEVQENNPALTIDDIKTLEAGQFELDDKTHWGYRPWKSWRHAFGNFEPHQLGGRLLSFDMSYYHPLDCPPLGSSGREGCYAVLNGEGLLSYSRGMDAIVMKIYEHCVGD